jgi:hypothetical protein
LLGVLRRPAVHRQLADRRTPVPKQVTDWCLKVKLGWEIAADGNASGCDAEQLDVYGTAEVASILKRKSATSSEPVERLRRPEELKCLGFPQQQ